MTVPTAEAPQLSFETQQVHAGQRPDPTTRSVGVPIYASTAFAFDNEQHVEDLCTFQTKGYHYSRVANPTNTVLEERIAKLEGGVGAVAVASGQAATLAAVIALARSGDNFVVSSHLYGGSFYIFRHFLPRLGITGKFVTSSDPREFASQIDENTKGILVESIANPTLDLFDLPALADLAHKAGVPLIVDNTFGAAGYLIRPGDLGADIILHSATKWIGGHGAALGGLVVDMGNFDWASNPRFPEFSKPFPGYHGMILTKQFGRAAFAAKMKLETMREMGATLSPFATHSLLQGLETLTLRVDKQTQSALRLAQWLEAHEATLWISHPGLASHPSHALFKRFLPRGSGGMLCFALKPTSSRSSTAIARAFIDATQLAIHAPNVGDVRTLVLHPQSTTHRQLTPDEARENGSTPDLIRVSVGIEDVDDIIADFAQAIEVVTKGAT
ncbi:uncharacterized protein RHOBADRAFT_32327 [Rhodotorula graminis WP1]|uniref:O-acetylhomoserine aminocarboxypropyltransferase n=1 Tax=Rhodotorula graminis (strain WP1) TaxID=578459 RepID=A0A0P9F943_RHOGW|nr:uncharacterized protein RHOBADRAFT_32327 [Rhodotorula graminis WP1]KPV72148.1 hypothetical protein RHOBADRAFT_32327 [Rhodotorula graminis WP1]